MTAEAAVVYGTPLMGADEPEPGGRRIRYPLSERAAFAKQIPDADVPWWAISLLDLKPGTNENRVRWDMQHGRRSQLGSEVFWRTWADLIERAQRTVMNRSLDDWIDEAYRQTDLATGEGSDFTNVVRNAALYSARAFCQFVNLCDDDGRVIILKDFHLRMIGAMRREAVSCVLTPFEHGKSFLGSMVVPLMDWAEWADCTEGRIYLTISHEKKWIRRLMGQVEHNTRLHKLFPWIRKPVKGDRCYGVWSTLGFAIGGRTLSDMSFEPLTAAAGATGNRYNRVIADDWETSRNASSQPEQEKLKEYLFTGPMTMPQTTNHQSHPNFGTRWSTFCICGTLFSRNGVNFDAFTKFKELGYKSIRLDIFPRGHEKNGTIWPEYRGPDWVAAKRRELGVKGFNMRCRNIVGGTTHLVFPPDKVAYAECDGQNGRPPLSWTVVPPFTRTMIGLDPGSGRITRDSKNPAVVVYGKRIDKTPVMLRDDRGEHSPADIEWHHLIEWNRMEGASFTQQCDFAAGRAQFYQCPIAVEDNNVQAGYADYLSRSHPNVKVICHTTTANKRDPKQGVEQWEPLFLNDRVLIHAHGAPQHQMNALREELLSYPGRYTDLIMASWIAKFQFALDEEQNRPIEITRALPSYVNRFTRRSYAMSTLR